MPNTGCEQVHGRIIADDNHLSIRHEREPFGVQTLHLGPVGVLIEIGGATGIGQHLRQRRQHADRHQ